MVWSVVLRFLRGFSRGVLRAGKFILWLFILLFLLGMIKYIFG